MPGLSGFAIPFIEWFFELHNSSTCVVSFDYRGFGLSEYDDNKNIVYDGININTIAVDLYNLYSLLKLQNKNLFILGHSFGNLVAYNLLNNFNISNICGFIQIEESLMNVSQINAMDPTYPKISSFSWNNVEKWVSQYQTYSPTNGYYLVNSTLLEQFVIPGFAKTKHELNTWMKYTTNMNGNILGLLFKDAMMVDYTYMVNAIFVKKNIPMFIYSGEGSIVPSKTQIWIYNKVSNNKLSKLLLISASNGGYHTPFLPTSIAKRTLFQNIHKYIKNINDSLLNNDNTLYFYQTKMLQNSKKQKKIAKTKKIKPKNKRSQTKIRRHKRK
jgi:pimeloyl-ACP methyl ester carboxylesterase